MFAFLPAVQTSVYETKFGLINLPISFNTGIFCGNITHSGGFIGDHTEIGTTESGININGSNVIYICMRTRQPRESNDAWGAFGIILGY